MSGSGYDLSQSRLSAVEEDVKILISYLKDVEERNGGVYVKRRRVCFIIRSRSRRVVLRASFT